MTSRPRTGPTTQARRRRVVAGRTRASAMTTRPSSGTLMKAPGVRRLRWSGATRATHTTRRARIVSTAAMLVRTGPRLGTARAAAARSRSRSATGATRRGGVPVDPQPPHVVAERLGEQGERDDEGGLGQGRRQDVCGRDRQHDPLRRSDDLAPVARRQLLHASMAAATRLRGTRSVPRRSRAPTRRPSGRRTR